MAVSKASGGIYLPKANEQTQASLQDLTEAGKELINYQWQLEDVTTLKLAEQAVVPNQKK